MNISVKKETAWYLAGEDKLDSSIIPYCLYFYSVM